MEGFFYVSAYSHPYKLLLHVGPWYKIHDGSDDAVVLLNIRYGNTRVSILGIRAAPEVIVTAVGCSETVE